MMMSVPLLFEMLIVARIGSCERKVFLSKPSLVWYCAPASGT
jgi:hypothetical protein